MPDASLTKSIGANILQEMATEKPTPDEWSDWVRAKAYKYCVQESQVRKLVEQNGDILDLRVRHNIEKYAQRIAKAYAFPVAKAIKRLDEALDAQKVYIRTNKQGEITTQKYEPDWSARLDAVDKVVKMFGGYAAQEIRHEHDISGNLLEVEKGKLQARAAELFAELRKDPEFRQSLNEAEGVINIEAYEQMEGTSAGAPGDSGDAQCEEVAG